MNGSFNEIENTNRFRKLLGRILDEGKRGKSLCKMESIGQFFLFAQFNLTRYVRATASKKWHEAEKSS